MLEHVAVRVATAIDRRELLRSVARNTFRASALLAASGSVSTLLSGLAQAGTVSTCENTQGPGCPYHCGPSRCCSYLNGRPSGCNCSSGCGTCKSGTTHCKGRNYSGWSSGNNGCWACYGSWSPCKQVGCKCRKVTLCCDCSTSGCSDGGVCISSCVYTQVNCTSASGKQTITTEKISA